MASTPDRMITTIWLSLGVAAALAAGLLFWSAAVMHSQVRDKLVEQRLVIPADEAGGLRLLPTTDRDALLPHAGKPVNDAALAQAYEEHLVRVRLSQLGQGRTLEEVSTDYVRRCAQARDFAQCRELRGIKEDMQHSQTLQGLLAAVHTLDVVGQAAKAAAWAATFASLGLLVPGLLRLGKQDPAPSTKRRRARHIAT